MISVIITTKNRLNYLKKAIQSVLNQTYTNYEIIIVDDGSTDGTKDYCKKIQNKIITYYRNEESQGGNYCRNLGILKSKGIYISFLDDDDEWFETKLEKQKQKFDNSNKNIGLVCSGVQNVYNYFDKIIVKTNNNKKIDLKNIDIDIFLSNIIGNTSNPLILKSAIIEVGMFDENLEACQEYELWIRICQKYEVDYNEEPLIVYNIENSGINQISGNYNKYINSYRYINEKYKDILNKLDSFQIRKRNIHFYNNIYDRALKTGNKKIAKKELKNLLKQKFSLKYIIKYFIENIKSNKKIKFKIINKILKIKI